MYYLKIKINKKYYNINFYFSKKNNKYFNIN